MTWKGCTVVRAEDRFLATQLCELCSTQLGEPTYLFQLSFDEEVCLKRDLKKTTSRGNCRTGQQITTNYYIIFNLLNLYSVECLSICQLKIKLPPRTLLFRQLDTFEIDLNPERFKSEVYWISQNWYLWNHILAEQALMHWWLEYLSRDFKDDLRYQWAICIERQMSSPMHDFIGLFVIYDL